MRETTPAKPANYGQGDATFQAVGGEDGVRQLVDAFYDTMSTKPEYRRIYDWHPDDTTARDKLTRFLCGWMGGPKRYHEKYGGISIPRVHAHLAIGGAEKNMWLSCMSDALNQRAYPSELQQYLLNQLSIPAEHVRRTCER